MLDKEISDLIIKIHEKFNVENGYKISLKFMVDCLKLIQDDCPAIASQAISVADNFLLGKIPLKDLINARTECWSYLERKKASLNTQKAEFCMIRSAICALYTEPPSDDLSEILNWFVEIFSKTGNHLYAIKKLLKLHFFPTD